MGMGHETQGDGSALHILASSIWYLFCMRYGRRSFLHVDIQPFIFPYHAVAFSIALKHTLLYYLTTLKRIHNPRIFYGYRRSNRRRKKCRVSGRSGSLKLLKVSGVFASGSVFPTLAVTPSSIFIYTCPSSIPCVIENEHITLLHYGSPKNSTC